MVLAQGEMGLVVRPHERRTRSRSSPGAGARKACLSLSGAGGATGRRLYPHGMPADLHLRALSPG